MKKLLFLSSLFSFFLFSSCRKCSECSVTYSRTSTWGNHDSTSSNKTEVCGNESDRTNFIKWNSYKRTYEDPVEFGNIYTEERKVKCN